MRRLVIGSALAAAVVFVSGSGASAFGMHGGGFGGGMGGHMGGFGGHMGGIGNPGGMHAGGWNGGGWHNGHGGFGRGFGYGVAAGLGTGLALDALDGGFGYGDDGLYGYGYGYDPSYGAAPYATYGDGYGGTVGFDAGAPLQTGRSAAEVGRSCTTPVRVCTLTNASYVGNSCSCHVTGGRAAGQVTP